MGEDVWVFVGVDDEVGVILGEFELDKLTDVLDEFDIEGVKEDVWV